MYERAVLTCKIKWELVEIKSGLESALGGSYLSNFDKYPGPVLLFELMICPSAKKHSPVTRLSLSKNTKMKEPMENLFQAISIDFGFKG